MEDAVLRRYLLVAGCTAVARDIGRNGTRVARGDKLAVLSDEDAT